MTRTISKLAKELGVSVETIRFYERKGLIVQPLKPAQGYRHYPDNTVSRIRFIKRAQELGFTLTEINNLLTIDELPCNQVEALATLKLNAIREKIKDLQQLELSLSQLLSECRVNSNIDTCPIIEALQYK